MRTGRGQVVILVTCGARAEARRIARKLIQERLAACVNIVDSPLESIYRWNGKIETAREFLLVIKTVRRRLAAVERAVRGAHSYDLPEILVLPVAAGSSDYLAWLEDSIK